MAKDSLLKSFPRTFWTANVMELFERGAYYGMNSILAIYLTRETAAGGLGFTEESVGFLQAVIYAFTYILPILGGALAEKLGYRRMLITSFLFLSLGYFAAGQFSSYGLVFAALAVMGFGAGLFKPIISGTIARTTNEKNSTLGFGIYYWMINLGAFLGPIVVNILKRHSWRYVFYASAAYVFLMLIPALFIFRDPELSGKGASLRQTARNALTVLGDSRFMLMVFIYSIFWILYFQNFGSILWFMRDFVDKAPVNRLLARLPFPVEFSEEFVTAISALTIILFQVPISWLFKRFRAVPTMCTGMIIGTLGFLFFAFSRNPWVFILGLVVFALGEMTAHPKYYSYVGAVAPQDRKAIYMGYAFLYGVIGALFGSSFGASLYVRIAKSGDPRLFFLLFFALGVIGFAGLIIFDRFFSQDSPAAHRRARIFVSLIYLFLTAGGAWLVSPAFSGGEVSPKVWIQAGILIVIGLAGLTITLRRRKIVD